MANRHPVFLEVPARPGIRLRKTAAYDSFALLRLVDENRDYLEPQTWTHTVKTVADAHNHVHKKIAEMDQGTGMQYRVLEGSGTDFPRMVGTVTLHSYKPEEREAFLGYWLAEEAAGKGYASNASRRLVQYAKEVWDLDHINMEIAPTNDNSERLALALGAELTDRSRLETPHNGQPPRIVRTWSMPV